MPYFQKLKEILKLEYAADKAQYMAQASQKSLAERRAAGLVWYPVAIRGQELDRADYLSIELERTTHHEVIDQFRAGMPVRFFSNHEKERDYIDGTIKHVQATKLKLSLRVDELPDWASDGKLGVELLFDDKSYDEMFEALKTAENILSKAQNSPQKQLIETLLGLKKADMPSVPFSYENPKLNASQLQAVQNILASPALSVVHGPPGTGKTTTLVQAIKALSIGAKAPILVVAPSNTAVDLLSEKLDEEGLNVIRIGNPSRISPKLMALTLEGKSQNHPANKEIKNLRKRAAEFKNMAHKYKRQFGRAEREQRKALFDEAYKILKDVEKEEAYINNDLFDKAQVITATLVGCNHYTVSHLRYAAVVIDEAGQALEPACWIPILKSDKLILAGDHQQLPPTIKSSEASALANTLLEKCSHLQPQTMTMLAMQYRMHEKIMAYPSAYFYKNQLQAHETVGARLLFQNDKPLLFVDTAGCGFDERQEGSSSYNVEEADMLIKVLAAYLNGAGLAAKKPSIALISPYKKQVEYLKDHIRDLENYEQYQSQIDINTIDSFQGQERDLVCISLCRSNSNQDIGFLADIRRMNVAMTRARMKLIVVGDSATLSISEFYAGFIDHCQQQDCYQSAWEYM